MKKIAFPFLLLLCLLRVSYAQVMNDISSIRQAIENINQVAPNGASDRPQMRKISQYQVLEQSSPAIWETAVNNLSEVAPTENDQTILFQSFEGLPPEEYLQFLNQALDLYSQRKISLGVFTGIFFPAGKMQLFISHNYDQPEVAAFLEKAEEVLKKKDEPLMFNIQEARSGKLKQLHDAARANHPELAKQPIPLLRPSAPPPTSAQTTPVPAAATPVQQPKSTAPATPSPTVAETKSSPGFPIVPVAIVGAVIVGIVLYLLRHKST